MHVRLRGRWVSCLTGAITGSTKGIWAGRARCDRSEFVRGQQAGSEDNSLGPTGEAGL